MADVFISYCREDRAPVSALMRALGELGLTISYDEQFERGENFVARIHSEITSSGATIVCWSEAASKSQWVNEEATFARKLNKYVGCQIARGGAGLGFATLNNDDLTRWGGDTNDLAFLAFASEIGKALKRDEIAGLHGAEKKRLDAEEQKKQDEKAEKVRQEEIARQLEAARLHAAEQREAEQRRREAERRRSIAEKLTPIIRPYCVWFNPVVVALTINFVTGAQSAMSIWLQGAANLGYNILPALISSCILWGAMLRPAPASFVRYLLACLLQWPLTWAVLFLIEWPNRLMGF